MNHSHTLLLAVRVGVYQALANLCCARADAEDLAVLLGLALATVRPLTLLDDAVTHDKILVGG